MNANPELDALVRRETRVAFDHSDLDFDRAAHCVDDAAELGDGPVARALDDTPVMRGDGGIDEIATEAPQARQGAILVRRGESTIPDNVGHQDCSELARLPHGSPSLPLIARNHPKGFYPSSPPAPDLQQRLRLTDLRHFGRRRKAFERGREDGVGFGGSRTRLIELGERQRRAQFKTASALLLCDGDGGQESFFGGRGNGGIAY